MGPMGKPTFSIRLAKIPSLWRSAEVNSTLFGKGDEFCRKSVFDGFCSFVSHSRQKDEFFVLLSI
jgi:hypothetical protein